MGASVINVYFRMVMPTNRLRVNHFDFMALHSYGEFSKGLLCLSIDTHIEFPLDTKTQ